MRITVVTFDIHCGGVQRIVAGITKEFADLGHSVSLVTCTSSEPAFFPIDDRVIHVPLTRPDGRAYRLETTLQRLNPWQRWNQARDLRRLIVNTQPDVVISYEDVLNVGVLISLLGLQTPIVATEHSDPERHRIPWVWRMLRPWAYRRAAAVVVLNDSIRKRCERLWPGCRILAIPNFLPFGLPSPAAEQQRCPGSRTLLAVGRLVRAKGFDLLIEAFAALGPECAEWRLVIVGEGPERRALEATIASLGLGDRIALPGAASDPTPFLDSADLFVVSSRYEGFCLAMVEAMAAALPVVSFACPSGPPEIVDHQATGVLVPPEDTRALAHALRELMRDDKRRYTLGCAARVAARKYSASSIMPLWSQLIRDVVHDAARGHNVAAQ